MKKFLLFIFVVALIAGAGVAGWFLNDMLGGKLNIEGKTFDYDRLEIVWDNDVTEPQKTQELGGKTESQYLEDIYQEYGFIDFKISFKNDSTYEVVSPYGEDPVGGYIQSANLESIYLFGSEDMTLESSFGGFIANELNFYNNNLVQILKEDGAKFTIYIIYKQI